MKVNIDISPECREPYAVIHTDKVTDEIQRMIDVFSHLLTTRQEANRKRMAGQKDREIVKICWQS